MQVAEVGRYREKNKDLAAFPGLRRQVKAGREYFLLDHSKLPRTFSLGSNKEEAIAAYTVVMQQINQLDLSPMLASHAPAPKLSLAEVIDRFKAGNHKKWAPSTQKENFTRLDRIRKQYGKQVFTQMSVTQCRDIIHSFQGDGRRQAKNLLKTLWDYAIGEGYSDKFMVNYPAKVNLPPKQKRQRERIQTIDDFQAAKANCPEWLQDAADIALITLQARMEIVTAKIRKNIITRDETRYLQFQRQKTINSTGHAVEIEITNNLAPIIQRCLERSLTLGACPFLISANQRETSTTRKAKVHRSQVLPEYITKAWTEATGFTFHEIRSLGRRIYEERLREEGFTREQIQHYICSLTGWTDEKMYALYGETDEIKYVTAKAELKI